MIAVFYRLRPNKLRTELTNFFSAINSFLHGQPKSTFIARVGESGPVGHRPVLVLDDEGRSSSLYPSASPSPSRKSKICLALLGMGRCCS